jgi:hypothetical protein
MGKHSCIIALAVCSLVLCLPAPQLSAQPRTKAAGVLMEKPSHDQVVIDATVYTVDFSADIRDDLGTVISLDKIDLQSRLYIEYALPAGGAQAPVIRVIRVLPQ